MKGERQPVALPDGDCLVICGARMKTAGAEPPIAGDVTSASKLSICRP